MIFHSHQLGAIKYFAFQGALPRLQNIFDTFLWRCRAESWIICGQKYAKNYYTILVFQKISSCVEIDPF